MSFLKLRNIIGYLLLKRTKKNRNELRHQRIISNNNRVMAIDWLKEVSKQLPKLTYKGNPTDHHYYLKKYYYKFDIAGPNYYIQVIGRTIKKNIELYAKPETKTAKQ